MGRTIQISLTSHVTIVCHDILCWIGGHCRHSLMDILLYNVLLCIKGTTSKLLSSFLRNSKCETLKKSIRKYSVLWKGVFSFFVHSDKICCFSLFDTGDCGIDALKIVALSNEIERYKQCCIRI